MTTPIQVCLWFNGQAKEAATFYSSLFDRSGIKSANDLVVSFELAGRPFIGLNGGPMYNFTPAVSMFVRCSSPELVNTLWALMNSGGKVMMDLGQYPWCERYGWLQDRFGLSWQLFYDPAQQQPVSITPSLLFTANQFGRSEEATNFYQSIFNHSSTTVLQHYPDGDGNAGKVLFSAFTINGQGFISMDGPGVHDFTFNEAISFVVNCESQAEIDFFWEKLTSGGEESMCGWLKDKFGISWQIIPEGLGAWMSDPQKAPRVARELMKMRKLDMELLKNA